MAFVKRNDGKYIWVVTLEKGSKKKKKTHTMYMAAATKKGAIKAARTYNSIVGMYGSPQIYARLADPVRDLGMHPVTD